MLIFVTVLFGLSYLPFHALSFMLFYTQWIPQTRSSCHSSTLYMLGYWLGISSCGYNVSVAQLYPVWDFDVDLIFPI